jgi:hypothetical protein
MNEAPGPVPLLKFSMLKLREQDKDSQKERKKEIMNERKNE